MHLFSGNARKVIVPRRDVALFMAQWPCSGLSASRSYFFEFGANGDLVDTDVPEHSDGPAALALAQDCQTFLETGALPDWRAD